MADISVAYSRISQNLPAIHAFVLVARYGNFTAAASALGMSQSAVSQRVRALELELGEKLFNREHRGVSLTHEGLRLHSHVQPAMLEIEKAVTTLFERKSVPRVRISADFTFSSFWLLPRLGDLRTGIGDDIEVQMLASQELIEVNSEECDISIHIRPFDGILERDVMLLQERVVDVCSPEFLEENGPIKNANQLLDQPLLSVSMQPDSEWQTWEGWFQALEIRDERSQPYMSFNNCDMVIQAAIDGQGIALGWLGLVDKAIEDGLLVQVTPDVVASEAGYVMSRDYTSPSRGPELIFDWIAENIGKPKSN